MLLVSLKTARSHSWQSSFAGGAVAVALLWVGSGAAALMLMRRQRQAR